MPADPYFETILGPRLWADVAAPERPRMPVPAARHRVGHPAALCGQWCGPGTRRTALAMENMGVLMRPSMMLRRCHEQNEKRRVRTQSAPPAAGEHCSEVPGHRDNMCGGGDECARACRRVAGASLTRKGEDERSGRQPSRGGERSTYVT